MKIEGKVVIMCRIIACVLSLFLMLISCSEKIERVSKYPDLLNEAVDTIAYSQFVDLIKYIPLETTDACLIGNITDVEISEEHIFVLDLQMQTVWIFSRDGKYRGQVFHKGTYVFIMCDAFVDVCAGDTSKAIP